MFLECDDSYFSLTFLFIVLDNYDLVSVVLPTSLVAISNYAFYDCYALKTIIIPT